MTATLLRWPLLNPHHTWHYLHTGKRRAFAKALVFQQQTHHFLPCKRHVFFWYRSHSLHCSHFTPKGLKLYMATTKQRLQNLCEVTALVVSEREKGDLWSSGWLCVNWYGDRPLGNHLPLAWKWKSEKLASKFPLLHCRKFCKRTTATTKVFKVTTKGITLEFSG